MIRTHKLALEEKIGEVLNVDTAAMAWLVEHRADVLNKCQQGKDGRTPYERLRGWQFSGSMLEFGSQVMLKVVDKVSGGVMQERWVEGTWLGSRFNTWLPGSRIVRTRAVRDHRKSPTVEDQVRTSGHTRTLHKVFNVTAGWTYLDQKSTTPLQCPIRVVLFHERCTPPEPYWKGMVILTMQRHATWADLWHWWSHCRLPQTHGGCFDTG